MSQWLGNTSAPSAALAWVLLFIAGLFEVSWAVGLRYTEGFTRLVPSAVTTVCMLASVGLLGFCVRALPLGTAYAVWTGIGVIGTVAFGILVFHEPMNVGRMVCVAMIFSGIVGLRVLYQP